MTRAEKAVRNEEIIALRRQNWSMQELADKFELTHSAIHTICKAAGLGGKMSDRRGKFVAPPKQAEEKVAETVRKRIPSFEYVGNYTGSDGTADIRCLVCGTITTRSWITIRHDNVVCRVCEKENVKHRQEERRRIKQEQAKEKQEQNKKKQEQRKKDRFWCKDFSQQHFRICVMCGQLFLSSNNRKLCCSEKCTKKRQNSKDKRVARIKGAMIDRDISLKILYQKEHGVCYLCNGKCSWSDYYIDRNGQKITGGMYPSIDHVIPLAKGGKHSWENVRLAHRECNWIKSDAV